MAVRLGNAHMRSNVTAIGAVYKRRCGSAAQTILTIDWDGRLKSERKESVTQVLS